MVIPIHDRSTARRRPYALWALLALNVVVFLLIQPQSSRSTTLVTNGNEVVISQKTAFNLQWAGIPCELRQGHPLTYGQAAARTCAPNATTAAGFSTDLPPAVETAEIFPDKPILLAPVFSIFFHGSVWHLVGNLLFLWVFGKMIEDRMGPALFVIFYLVAGAVATLIQFAFTSTSTVPVIGASGAVAGLMGAYLVFWPKARITSLVPVLLFIVIEIPAFVVLLIWFGLQFFTAPDAGIAWIAHVGGFAFGAAVAAIVRYLWPGGRNRGPVVEPEIPPSLA